MSLGTGECLLLKYILHSPLIKGTIGRAATATAESGGSGDEGCHSGPMGKQFTA